MGKTHKGINEKALEARVRKEQQKISKKQAEDQAKEDAFGGKRARVL